MSNFNVFGFMAMILPVILIIILIKLLINVISRKSK